METYRSSQALRREAKDHVTVISNSSFLKWNLPSSSQTGFQFFIFLSLTVFFILDSQYSGVEGKNPSFSVCRFLWCECSCYGHLGWGLPLCRGESLWRGLHGPTKPRVLTVCIFIGKFAALW